MTYQNKERCIFYLNYILESLNSLHSDFKDSFFHWGFLRINEKKL